MSFSTKQNNNFKRLLCAVAISGLGVGCVDTQEQTPQEVYDEPVVQEEVESASPEAQIKVIDDNNVQVFLGDKAFSFVISKGWPVEWIDENTVTFTRHNDLGFSTITVIIEPALRTPQQFIQEVFPNVNSEGATYHGVTYGTNTAYLSGSAGRNAVGAIAQYLNGKLVSVQFATNSEPATEIGFEHVIATLHATEVK